MSTPNQRDLVIIGGGPAGYSAALYAARASLDTLVVEQGMPGGQIATSDMIDNYPGIERCSGAELGQKMQAHAESAGAQSTYGSVQSLTRHESGFTITTDMDSIEAKSVIVATGATPRPGNFSGEEMYRGRGVSYCATCDGMFYRGKHVFIIGGGNSAVEEALYLSNLADQVEIIVRRDLFRASRGMVDRVSAKPNISIRYRTSITEVAGSTFINAITFQDNATGETHVESYDEGSVGIFVAVGHDPATNLVAGLAELGPDGGVLTDEHMGTTTPGLYCAGDMRSKSLRQVVTAAADGAIAATAAYHYIESLSA